MTECKKADFQSHYKITNHKIEEEGISFKETSKYMGPEQVNM
jgi:hypothetical protein